MTYKICRNTEYLFLDANDNIFTTRVGLQSLCGISPTTTHYWIHQLQDADGSQLPKLLKPYAGFRVGKNGLIPLDIATAFVVYFAFYSKVKSIVAKESLGY